MRILVAEDETIIRLDLRGLLERAGHDVVGEARDGEEAVALARETQPELVIMDVKMPRLDGIEAARRLLMEKEKLSEADAFARLRKASQVSGRPLRVISEAVIATFEAS